MSDIIYGFDDARYQVIWLEIAFIDIKFLMVLLLADILWYGDIDYVSIRKITLELPSVESLHWFNIKMSQLCRYFHYKF